METKIEKVKPKTLDEATIELANETVLNTAKMKLGVWCGMKKITLKSEFLKNLQKTEQQLNEYEKSAFQKCWSPGDILQVLADCAIAGINPASRYAYMAKYGEVPTLIIGYQHAIDKANADQNYNGMKKGIIVQKESGEIERRQGAWKLPNEILVAGWAEVYRKDREYPEIAEVSFAEHENNNAKKVYDKVNKKYTGEVEVNEMWKTKPCQQIEKVAVAQATNRAFSHLFKNSIIADTEEIENIEFEEIKENKTILQPVKQPTISETKEEVKTDNPEEENPF